MKPMVKATMPTIKAETRKTCDTEPAAGGIARTMTLAPARRDCARCAAPRGNFHGHSVSRQPGEKQRTRFNAIRKRSRSPGHRQLSLAGFLVRGGALRRKGASAKLSTPCVYCSSPLEFSKLLYLLTTRIRHYIEVHSPRGSAERSLRDIMQVLHGDPRGSFAAKGSCCGRPSTRLPFSQVRRGQCPVLAARLVHR